MKNFVEDEIRSDGRFRHELRRIRMSHDVIGTHGTITFSQGETQVAGTVIQLKDKGEINFNIQFYGIARTDAIHERRLYDLRIKLVDIFKPVICTENQVNIDLTVKQDDGSLLAVLINTTTLVLCYNGIPMVDMCLSVCVGDGFDLCAIEQNKEYAMTLAYLIHLEKVVYVFLEGRCQKKMFADALSNAVDCCKIIEKHFSEYLKNIAENPTVLADIQ